VSSRGEIKPAAAIRTIEGPVCYLDLRNVAGAAVGINIMLCINGVVNGEDAKVVVAQNEHGPGWGLVRQTGCCVDRIQRAITVAAGIQNGSLPYTRLTHEMCTDDKTKGRVRKSGLGSQLE
jgi:hypothetical protein